MKNVRFAAGTGVSNGVTNGWTKIKKAIATLF